MASFIGEVIIRQLQMSLVNGPKNAMLKTSGDGAKGGKILGAEGLLFINYVQYIRSC